MKHLSLLTAFSRLILPALLIGCLLTVSIQAEVRTPAIFGEHMVLQRDQQNAVWGWADEGEVVTVNIANQKHTARTGPDGRWKVKLDPLPAGGPHTLEIKGKNTLRFDDVLIGEVWICSGQSNMQWGVNISQDPDLEKLSAHYPGIRHISVPQVGTQEPQHDFNGQWEVCSPDTIGAFSAVGYYFGRQLHQSLRVPIGLIDNSWGGSSAEAWVKRDLLEAQPRFRPLMERWEKTEREYDPEAIRANYEQRLAAWEKERDEAVAAKREFRRNRPRMPRSPLANQHRPANLFNGVLQPIIGYGIKGVIWYQGESNANRAWQYRELFPLMIQNWRQVWQQGDFPFYWVQLADYRQEKDEPGDSDWAELREAQTLTLDRIPNTGQAVITDLGEADDIHPKNKQDVAKRLARLALAKDYGLELVHQSPRYSAMKREGSKIILTFSEVGGGMDTFDVRTPIGFTVAGEKRKFHRAQAKIIGKDQIEVWSDEVADPIAVRYAWADNPVCNVQNREGLPLTPFRTDDWPGVTIDNH